MLGHRRRGTPPVRSSRLVNMGFLDSIKSWLSSEAAEASDLGRDTKGRLEAELDRREAELTADPLERFEQLQAKMADDDDAFGALKDKIEGREMKAHADAEVAEIAQRAAEAVGDTHDIDGSDVIDGNVIDSDVVDSNVIDGDVIDGDVVDGSEAAGDHTP
jgi:hypothetical protein